MPGSSSATPRGTRNCYSRATPTASTRSALAFSGLFAGLTDIGTAPRRTVSEPA